jgi:DNA repair protein RecN (Recombination protein N)
MLNRLEISNYALIENASLQFQSGFTAITGETGAGKSILLKALNLLLGERADTSVLKQSEKKCFLEAEFDIRELDLNSFFKSNELDYEPFCIIRREFSPSGKSRCFINDSPVQIKVLSALGNKLVNIHSQHQTLDLFDSTFQTEVIDTISGIEDKVLKYCKKYTTYRNKVNEHISLQVKDMENRKEKDYLTFLINELNAADLSNLNLDDLKSKSDKIEFSEKISEGLSLAKSIFNNETYGPLNGIKSLIENFEELKGFDKRYADILSRLLSVKIELDDIDSEIQNQSGDLDFDDSDAELIKEKMELLNSLCFKHNLSEVSDLIELQAKLNGQLQEIGNVEDRLNTLSIEIEADKQTLLTEAQEISKIRRSNAVDLCNKVKLTLDRLAMPEAEMQVDFQTLEKIGPNGIDQIQFLFKTNKGGQYLPLKKVASGGELSRLMLTILSIISEIKSLPTLIFDEIDTGVSGEVGAKIASEFVKMGGNIQLIVITHLPQVAARGNTHLHVSKSNNDLKTITSVTSLTGDNRITELAKMISGEEVTTAAKENALHLLNKS